MSPRRYSIGTRRSPLARAQTELVLRRLHRHRGTPRWSVRPMLTGGDRDRSIGSSPDFTDALDRALLNGEIDLAVHSAKDLPLVLPEGLAFAACPSREDPRDCLVLAPGERAAAPSRGARIGSSSTRRRAQLLRWRDDLEVVEIRGNVDTRLRRVGSGDLDGVVLAVAGLRRLGREAEIDRFLPVRDFLPAPAQGALAVLARDDDTEALRIARTLDDRPTRWAVDAERAFARTLGGDCSTPLGALAELDGRRLRLRGELLSPDGRRRLRARVAGDRDKAESLGEALGERLLALGAGSLLRAAR